MLVVAELKRSSENELKGILGWVMLLFFLFSALNLMLAGAELKRASENDLKGILRWVEWRFLKPVLGFGAGWLAEVWVGDYGLGKRSSRAP